MIQAGTQGSELFRRGLVRIVEIQQVGLRRGPVRYDGRLHERAGLRVRANRLGGHGHGVNLGRPDLLDGGGRRLRRRPPGFGPP